MAKFNWRRSICTVVLTATLSGCLCRAEMMPNGYDPNYGVFIGKLAPTEYGSALASRMTDEDSASSGIGAVYAINDSAIQIFNFTWPGRTRDTFFWLDSNARPSLDNGVRVPTFEYDRSPIGSYGAGDPSAYGVDRVVLIVPNEAKISAFKTLSLFSTEENVAYTTVKIPDGFAPPKTQILPDELQGSRYRISGVVQVIDTRTIRIIGFSFEGNKAPDGYFFVGQGLNVSRESGVKAAIRGRDLQNMITPMSERYTGGRDVYVELPDGYDIPRIDFLAIYSIRFDVVYASILLRNVSRYSIPPYVPAQRRIEDVLAQRRLAGGDKDSWTLSNLLGTTAQLNFTFQLGPSGGALGYQSMHGVPRPPQYVWYVNGYLANLYLKRGETYNFIVEGGRNASMFEFNNPLYLTDDSYGGFAKQTSAERQNVKIYAPADPPADAAGRLCRWMSSGKHGDDADQHATFADYRATLRLVCQDEEEEEAAAETSEDVNTNGSGAAALPVTARPKIFSFTPTAETPDMLYYQSYNNYQMGAKIFVVDAFPADLKHIVEEPFRYEAWRHQDNLELARENGVSRFTSATAAMLAALWILIIFM